jgi:hypothetical protein
MLVACPSSTPAPPGRRESTRKFPIHYLGHFFFVWKKRKWGQSHTCKSMKCWKRMAVTAALLLLSHQTYPDFGKDGSWEISTQLPQKMKMCDHNLVFWSLVRTLKIQISTFLSLGQHLFERKKAQSEGIIICRTSNPQVRYSVGRVWTNKGSMCAKRVLTRQKSFKRYLRWE